MNRVLLSVVLVLLTLTLKGAADDGHCDVSACMKEVKWPNGTYGIYNPINTEVNISNNGFISQEAWLIVRFTGSDGRVYKPREDEYFTLPDVGTSRWDGSTSTALDLVGQNGTLRAPDDWYNESVQLKLPSGDILDQENKTHAFEIRS